VDVAREGLRLVTGGAASTAPAAPAADPVAFQDGCLLAFEASQVARGFSQASMDNGSGVLERFLTACGRPAWDVTREDVDRVVAGLSAQGLAASTRRGYVQAFKGFHAFLVARKAAEIEAVFGVRLVNPVDEFNAARHVGADSPSVNPPPVPERMEEFFDFLKERIAGARKYTAAGRDYALFRTLYLAGAAGGGVRFAGPGRCALRPGAVRQAACPVRQGCQDIGPAAAVGADAGWPGPDLAVVSGGDPSPAW
jgi:integrase/recombinase XerD